MEAPGRKYKQDINGHGRTREIKPIYWVQGAQVIRPRVFTGMRKKVMYLLVQG